MATRMSLSALIAKFWHSAAAPLTASDIRKALGGGVRPGQIVEIDGKPPYVCVANARGQTSKPMAAPDAVADKPARVNGSRRAKTPIPPAVLPTLADAEAMRQANINDRGTCIDQPTDRGEAVPDDVSINRAHLRTLTYLAMHSGAPLDHDAYVAIVAGARRTLL